MSSRNRRDREERTSNRGKDSMAPQQPRGRDSSRMNEYFVPDDGIDREVIATDICRYLGNDALVRPGNYENPATRQVQRGYFITSYRNLTTAMIADLKADSERWLMEKENLKSSPENRFGIEYRTSMTHMSRQYDAPTIESSAVIPQSQDDKAHVPNSYLKSLWDPFYGAPGLVSDGSPNDEGGNSTMATNAPPPTLPIEGHRASYGANSSSVRSFEAARRPRVKEYHASYGADSSSVRSFEAARRPRIREQPTISTYGAQTQLLQTAEQSAIADSITRAGIITAGTIGTIGSIGVGSSYYTSQQANAQNEAKLSWEREQARRRERLDDRERGLERQEQALRERESTVKEQERNLQVDLTHVRELEHDVHVREEGIRRKEDGLNKTNKEYGDWGKELNKVQADIMRRENELKERSEEPRITAVKLREREDELSRTEKKNFEQGEELRKIQAEITRSQHELRQNREELREREDEWKRQQQQCHCRHRALEPSSDISSQTRSTSGNESPKLDLSPTLLETDKCSTLTPTNQSSNQIRPSHSLTNEDSNPNQQLISLSISTASQPSTAEAKTSSQPITMGLQDTEPTESDTAPVTPKLVSSELKKQLLTETNLDLQVRSPNKDDKNTNHLAFPSIEVLAERESGKEGSGKVREEVNEIASENGPKRDGSVFVQAMALLGSAQFWKP